MSQPFLPPALLPVLHYSWELDEIRLSLPNIVGSQIALQLVSGALVIDLAFKWRPENGVAKIEYELLPTTIPDHTLIYKVSRQRYYFVDVVMFIRQLGLDVWDSAVGAEYYDWIREVMEVLMFAGDHFNLRDAAGYHTLNSLEYYFQQLFGLEDGFHFAIYALVQRNLEMEYGLYRLWREQRAFHFGSIHDFINSMEETIIKNRSKLLKFWKDYEILLPG